MDGGDNASTGLSDFTAGTLGSLTSDHSFMVGSENSEVDESLGEDPSENDQSDEGHSQTGRRRTALREQDRFLPIANVSRIMKVSIPKSGKIAKDAKECVQECVSEFVSFITSEASDRCHQEKRKTINGEDILFAMQTLGFDNYVGPLKLYLNKFREAQKGEKGSSLGGGLPLMDGQSDGSVHPEAAMKMEGYSEIQYFNPLNNSTPAPSQQSS